MVAESIAKTRDSASPMLKPFGSFRTSVGGVGWQVRVTRRFPGGLCDGMWEVSWSAARIPLSRKRSATRRERRGHAPQALERHERKGMGGAIRDLRRPPRRADPKR